MGRIGVAKNLEYTGICAKVSSHDTHVQQHGVLFRTWASSKLVNVPSRASSLSAIHRGLHNSEKARHQGFKESSSKSPGQSRPAQASKRPTFAIKKGKKDITDKGPRPKKRAQRFADPDYKFGKKSLVYELKFGRLKERLAVLDGNTSANGKSRSANRKDSDGGTASSFKRGGEGALTKAQFMEGFNSSPGRLSGSDSRTRPTRSSKQGQPSAGRGESRRSSLPVRSPRSQREAPSLSSRRSTNVRDAINPDRSVAAGQDRSRREQDVRVTREPQADEGREQSSSRQDFSRDERTIRIHHTTAASQFLYGRSVVEAALRSARRQLYRLYIHRGEDRERDPSQDAVLERMAKEKGVPITNVGSGGQLMMNKMSGNRPHNGFVLEASPLPQLPIKALGPLSEDPAKRGFSLELAHQSSEEALVNGTSDFISHHLPDGRYPFVLLLDGILDPGNLGAIMRTAAFLGVSAVAITKRSSATLTSVALKASSGGAEVMTLLSVNSTLEFLARSKESGWTVYAAVPSTSRSRGNSHLTIDRVESYDPLSTQPTILVVGSEGEGLTKQVRRQADFEVSIPSQSGLFSVVDSLNVSVATGILCSAFLNKQHSGFGIEESTDAEDESQLW
ncbi:hypothetical protein F4779DRAFT_626038 [Xylariaceae sp. FL0662B]|nr:hypothetical protein F4779DRAFT_626038 [Xylariaceae sp. FL0662B]